MRSNSLTCGEAADASLRSRGLSVMRQLFAVYWGVVLLSAHSHASDVRFVASSRRFNPKFVSNFSTSVGKDPNKLNLDVTLLRPIVGNVFAFVDLQIRLKDAKRYQSLFSENFDACKMANSLYVDSLMKKWFRNILKYGNFMEYCPVPEGHYFFRGLMVEQTSLAMYLRPGDYRIVGDLYLNEPGKKNESIVQAIVDVKWVN